VLLGSRASLGLEPMRKVGGATIHGPDTNGMGDGISSSLVKGLATTHLLQERGIGRLGQGLGDLVEREDVLTEELGGVDRLAILLGVGDCAGGAVDVVREGSDASVVSHGREGVGIFTEGGLSAR